MERPDRIEIANEGRINVWKIPAAVKNRVGGMKDAKQASTKITKYTRAYFSSISYPVFYANSLAPFDEYASTKRETSNVQERFNWSASTRLVVLSKV